MYQTTNRYHRKKEGIYLEALEQLCSQLYPSLLKYFLSQLANYHTAEELTQETLFRACSSYSSFKGNSSLKTWIFGIAHNTLLSYYRKNQAKPFALELPTPLALEEHILIQEDYRKLIEAIHQLEETERQIVLLRSYIDLDFASIGEILSLTPTHCRVIYCRSRQKLKKIIEKENLK